MSNQKSAILLLSLMSGFQSEDELLESTIEALIDYKHNREIRPHAQMMSLMMKWDHIDRDVNNPFDAFNELSKDLDDMEVGKQYVNNIKNNSN